MFFALVLACALLAPSALPSAAASPPTSSPSSASSRSGWGLSAPARDGVSIVNSGSTNLAGYELYLLPNGNLKLGPGARAQRRASPAMARRFFADLFAAGPLDKLPAASCLKSASFGSWTRLTYRGKTSPDLSCPSPSQALRALAVDAAAVTDAAGIRPTFRRRPILP